MSESTMYPEPEINGLVSALSIKSTLGTWCYHPSMAGNPVFFSVKILSGKKPMPFLEIQLVLSPGSESTCCSSVARYWRYLAKNQTSYLDRLLDNNTQWLGEYVLDKIFKRQPHIQYHSNHWDTEQSDCFWSTHTYNKYVNIVVTNGDVQYSLKQGRP